ncbi:MAG: flavin reductase family protein [Elusimicrobia bacterium]|nr:flavin reductase family protein [Elusimicrobiota bacterium]
MELDPEKLPPAERYGLLISVIQPRPIAWVSTQNHKGQSNLAPFSFFTGITAQPMSVCFAPVRNRQGKKKDTLINIESTGEFVINVATQQSAEKMNQTSAEYPYGVSEFERAGLTPLPSVRVQPPRVGESPVSLECKLIQVIHLSEGPLGGNLVLGRIVYVHIQDPVWKEGKISHRDLQAIGRLEGSFYARVTDTFEMPRPRRPS